MKFAAIIEHGSDQDQLKTRRGAHRTYLRTFLENGQLRAAGPLADDAGALGVLDADTQAAVEDTVQEDPSVAAGAMVSWNARSFAYWAAQEAKGATRSNGLAHNAGMGCPSGQADSISARRTIHEIV